MSEYTVKIKIPDAGKEIPFSLTLNGSDESYPQDYFKREDVRSTLRQTIETQAHREVGQDKLKYIIDEWIQQIEKGRHIVTVKVDLDIMTSNRFNFQAEQSPDNFQAREQSSASRHQENLQSGCRVKPREPNRFRTNHNPSTTGEVNLGKDTSQPASEIKDKPKEKEPYVSVESNGNEPDF